MPPAKDIGLSLRLSRVAAGIEAFAAQQSWALCALLRCLRNYLPACRYWYTYSNIC
jgi:hypothetical protein